MDAIIKDNKAYCPYCEKSNYKIANVNIIDNNIRATAECENCNREFEYFLKISIDKNNIRWV